MAEANAEQTTEAKEHEKAPVPWADFLTSWPAPSGAEVSDVWTLRGSYYVDAPALVLRCDSETCAGGDRVFTAGAESVSAQGWNDFFFRYKCRNCVSFYRVFSLSVRLIEGNRGEAIKVGQWPPFAPPVPSRVIELIGPDREDFLRGRRAELHGLGIGAYAYYRRVVENQKNRLLDEIIKVARRVEAPESLISGLEAAKTEKQFSRAMDDVKGVIPESLLIRGRNPLTLLYRPLSEGIHQRSDEECLEMAQSIRVVLTELADRLGQALKDEAELTSAVSKLQRGFGKADAPRVADESDKRPN